MNSKKRIMNIEQGTAEVRSIAVANPCSPLLHHSEFLVHLFCGSNDPTTGETK